MPQWIGADEFHVTSHQEDMLSREIPSVSETNPFATKSFVTFSQPVIAVSQVFHRQNFALPLQLVFADHIPGMVLTVFLSADFEN